MAVYNACVISTLLYGSETWMTYAKQERRLNFHLRCIRHILGISWEDKRRLRCLGHIRRMEDGGIPKDILYGELACGKTSTGRPQLRFTDVRET
ncbi:hypothetical protein HOLleu_29701 [Holothuria leucospilota]|uniref:Uncharacterized protein n=1 Tax=Holothuria leucospilota TaxID=206669 RepID=A0A9Q1BJB3_HOLLE|nr:hypothetical protein HOLleu_29701 [Holothuria leucospilota]